MTHSECEVGGAADALEAPCQRFLPHSIAVTDFVAGLLQLQHKHLRCQAHRSDQDLTGTCKAWEDECGHQEDVSKGPGGWQSEHGIVVVGHPVYCLAIVAALFPAVSLCTRRVLLV